MDTRVFLKQNVDECADCPQNVDTKAKMLKSGLIIDALEISLSPRISDQIMTQSDEVNLTGHTSHCTVASTQ